MQPICQPPRPWHPPRVRLLLPLLLLFPLPVFAQPLLIFDAVPDPSAPWLQERPRQFAAYAQLHPVEPFLLLTTPLFGTQLHPNQPLRVHLVALHAGEHLRARTLGDDVAVQIREEDSPDRRMDVVVHEAMHALQQRTHLTEKLPLPPDILDLLDEALATALGQGIWRWLDHEIGLQLGEIAWRQGRDRYMEDNARPWYVAEKRGEIIDAWAHALVPVLLRALTDHAQVQALVPELKRTWLELKK